MIGATFFDTLNDLGFGNKVIVNAMRRADGVDLVRPTSPEGQTVRTEDALVGDCVVGAPVNFQRGRSRLGVLIGLGSKEHHVDFAIFDFTSFNARHDFMIADGNFLSFTVKQSIRCQAQHVT